MSNPTYYETIVHSPQWQAWEKVAHTHGHDWHESVECEWLSPNHFRAFLDWLKEDTLDRLVFKAQPDLREIVFHTNGEVTAKSGNRSPKPMKLYTGRPLKDQLPVSNVLARLAVQKLITDQLSTQPTNSKDLLE